MEVKTAYNYEDLDNIFNNGKVGDLIDFAPENQEGLIHYQIIEKDGVKDLKKIGDYWDDIAAEQMNNLKGGRKMKRKRTTKRRKHTKRRRHTKRRKHMKRK